MFLFHAIYPDSAFLLHCLNSLKHKDISLWKFLPDKGLQVGVEEVLATSSASFHCNVSLPPDQWLHFDLPNPPVPSFGLRLEPLLHSLSLLSIAPKASKPSPLDMSLELDHGALTLVLRGKGGSKAMHTCRLPALLTDPTSLPSTTTTTTSSSPSSPSLIEHPSSQLPEPRFLSMVQQRALMKSRWLTEAIMEVLEEGELTSITMQDGQDHQPFLRVASEGIYGSVVVECKRDMDVVMSLHCPTPSTFRYRTSHLERTLYALSLSTTCSMSRDPEGRMVLQVMIPREDGQTAFIDYSLLPVTPEDTSLLITTDSTAPSLPH